MKNKIFLLIVLLLLLPSAISQAEDLFYSRSLILDVSIGGGFRLEGAQTSRIDFVKAKQYFYPSEEYSQDILSINTSPDAVLLEEDYYEYYWENPSISTHKFMLDSKVRTYNRFNRIKSKIDFPIRDPDPGYREYLISTEKIDIDEDIVRQASEIVEGEDDLFEAVFKLASWNQENINYSLTTVTADASQKASWVLENRYGVCDEITNLFIAMCRSLGIPARFVSGISYTNSELFDEEWGLHGWAEVYFPGYGWVSFDPTYGQYGYVDAGHVKLKDSVDSDKTSTKYEWQGIKMDLETLPQETNVDVLEKDNMIDELVEISVVPFAKEVGLSSYNLIEAKLKNTQDYYVGIRMSLGAPKEIAVYDNTQNVLLKPNQEKSVFWIVKIDGDLSRDYIYTFPIEALGSLGYAGESSFKASRRSVEYSYSQISTILNNLREEETKTYSKNIEFECDGQDSVYVNETFEILCRITNTGNSFIDSLRVCIDKDCRTESIGISQTKNVSFTKSHQSIGENAITITASNRDINKITNYRIFVIDTPSISIGNVIYPELIRYGPEFEISFEISKESMSTPKNTRVAFAFNNKESEWFIEELEANQKFTVTLDKTILDPERNSFTIKAEYEGKDKEKYTETYTTPVEVEEPQIYQKILMWLSKVSRDIDNLIQKIFR